MTPRPLPDGTSLENLKKQAKSLLKSFRAGDASARKRIAPYFRDRAKVDLNEVQLVVAREYGFDSWSKLKAHVSRPSEGLSEDVEATLDHAVKEAKGERHEFMTTEHLMLALLDNGPAANVLKAVGADLESLRHHLRKFIDSTTPVILDSESEREAQPTFAFQRVLQRAVFHVQFSGRREATGANVLVSIFAENETQAVRLLEQQNIERSDVIN